MFDDVPLLIPEVNKDHVKLLQIQKEQRGWGGFIVTNPNCSTIVLVMTLKPLMQFGLSDVKVANAGSFRCGLHRRFIDGHPR